MASSGSGWKVFPRISNWSSSRVNSLCPTFFLQYINDLPDDAICNIGIYVGDTALNVIYSKYDQESDLWQQLELASELESDLQDTVFHWSKNNGAFDVKMDGC